MVVLILESFCIIIRSGLISVPFLSFVDHVNDIIRSVSPFVDHVNDIIRSVCLISIFVPFPALIIVIVTVFCSESIIFSGHVN